jgi:O-antigen/teichoic acid export membrane protein
LASGTPDSAIAERQPRTEASLGRRIPHAFLLSMIGIGLTVGVSLLLARTLGPERYGVYAYGMAWAMVALLAVGFGQDKLLLREAAVRLSRGDDAGVASLVGWSVRSLAGTSVAVLVVAAGALGAARALPEVRSTLEAVGFALVIVPFIAFTRAGEGLLRAYGSLTQGQLGEAVLRPGVMLTLCLLFGSSLRVHTDGGNRALHLQLLAAVISCSVILTLARRRSTGRSRRAARPEERRVWMASSATLAMVGGLQILNQKIDVLVLGGLLGAKSTGVYAAVAPLAALTTFALTVANISSGPLIAARHAAGDKRGLQEVLATTVAMATAFAALYLIVLVVMARPLLAFLGARYQGGTVFLGILAPAYLFNAFAGSAGLVLTMTGHEREVAKALAVSAVAGLVLNTVLVLLWGPIGAALASGITMIIWNLRLVGQAKRTLGVDPSIVSWIRSTSSRRGWSR